MVRLANWLIFTGLREQAAPETMAEVEFLINRISKMNTFSKPSKGRNRIRICRMLSHRSQEELAYLLDLPATTISRWENGSRTPGVYHAVGLSVALHRLVDDIFSEYRQEWIEKINKRSKELSQKV